MSGGKQFLENHQPSMTVQTPSTNVGTCEKVFLSIKELKEKQLSIPIFWFFTGSIRCTAQHSTALTAGEYGVQYSIHNTFG